MSRNIFRIAYCDFTSVRIDEELAYYTSVIGARPVEQVHGTHYLSLGLDHHNIALSAGAAPGLAVAGFQLRRDISLDDFAHILRDHGFSPQRKHDGRPGIPDLVALDDVVGFRFEFFSEMAMPAPGFGTQGIVPNRVGHIALLSPEAPRLIKFFTETLGFIATDWFDDIATFLTCNADHHVLNIVHAPITKLHHIAFEMRGSAHQYEAADMLAKAKLPIVWGPSRHTAGHNYASYHFDPDRTLIELYTDMDVYSADLNCFEPRPWHEELPLRPKVWPISRLNAWDTKIDFDFATA